MVTAVERMGDTRALLAKFRFTDHMLRLTGGITVLASNTEYWTERAIWRLDSIDPAEMRPRTDAKPISELIRQLATSSDKLPIGAAKDFIALWCRAAKPAYLCRNSIFHGATLPLGATAWFTSNARWHGELRKRPFSDFHADDNTLTLLQSVFGVLLQSITTIAIAKDELLSAPPPKALEALRTAESVAYELKELAAAVNHEKY